MNQTATGRWLRRNGAIVVLLDSISDERTGFVSQLDWQPVTADQRARESFQESAKYEGERTPNTYSELGTQRQTGQTGGVERFESPCPPHGKLPVSKAAPRDRSGCWYAIERGDNLFRVARAGLTRMLALKGVKATKSDVTAYAQCINSHPNNAAFRTGKPSGIFPDGSIRPAFLPLWSPADWTSRKRRGEKGSYAAIWLPRLGAGRNVCGRSITDRSSPKTDPSKPEPKTPSKPEPWDPSVLCDDLQRPAFRDAWKEAIGCLDFVAKRLDDIAVFSLPKRMAFWNHADNPERRWFGVYDEARFARIRKTVVSALTALRSRHLLVYCTTVKKWPKECRKFAAFVVRKKKDQIRLCPSFFGTTTGETTHHEKIVMLVHEAAHLGGAHIPIERYRMKNMQLLARYRPSAAAKNADNYACYVAQVRGLKHGHCDNTPRADSATPAGSLRRAGLQPM